MIYSVLNASASPRIFYDVHQQEIAVEPGNLRYVDLDEGTYRALAGRSDMVVKVATWNRHAPRPAAPVIAVSDKPAIIVSGHFGIGDNLHQRAVMKELMKTRDVWLRTCHFELYHDLVQQGLKLIMRPTPLHAQAKTIAREEHLFEKANFPLYPPNAAQANIGYPKPLIDQHGSILEAQFSCVGLRMPERPDFSLPIKPEWHKWKCDTKGKPLMIHRPIVVRREWDGRSRNPDPNAYDELYRSIRDQFFVVSIADLRPNEEWIDGPQQEVDVALHGGELSFPEMAALFADADLIFCNAGFAPVLAQAVGTPVVVVYGGRESYRTTQRVGAHLAPTLPIDVINPCDCHSARHACDKTIDLPVARSRLLDFVDGLLHRRTLIFGTFYIDSPDRSNLTDLWIKLHTTINPDCDFLAVDSQSPIKKFEDWTPYDGKRHSRMYFNFPDNIGHLSRKNVTQGRDGWGRAFCKGLEVACELGYAYVGHIEGDSLFRLKVADVVRQMKAEDIQCASTGVAGLRTSNDSWVETGLMFFTTDYLKRARFVERYDWPNRKVAPTPERYIRQQILEPDLGSNSFRLMPWKAHRADKNQIHTRNILSLGLDWITHQHDSSQQDVYRLFVDAALKEVVPDQTGSEHWKSDDKNVPHSEPQPQPQVPLVRLNLGCGTNKLAGWENYDVEVDITKQLRWADNSVSHISIEHCVEHVSYKAAIEFFKEAHRVLAPGGILRVTVPSLEQIANCEDADYHRFTTKWQNVGPTKRGAMAAIIYAHGHETVWNARMMRDTLFFAGFNDVRQYELGESDDPVLCGVEGHGKVIGDKFNRIESCTHEARKNGVLVLERPQEPEIAIVIGGAECWKEDLDAALKLIGSRTVRYFFINDQIKTFPEPGVACTLHPDKLNGQFAWLVVRKRAGLPDPEEVWAHRKHAAVTHDTASKEWRGSSGLFAVQVAHGKGHTKIIGCGIPMTPEGKHFERHINWSSAHTFRDGWLQSKHAIAPYFRSMSGWTAEQFGKPDEAWMG